MKESFKGESGIATVLLVVLIVLSVVVGGVVITAAVILTDDVTITVTNQSCNTLKIGEGTSAGNYNFLPGFNVPDEIARGDTAKVQFPDRFVDSVTVGYSSVEVHASLSQSFKINTGSLNMQLSTWDGTPLAELVGQEIEISKSHTLVLACN